MKNKAARPELAATQKLNDMIGNVDQDASADYTSVLSFYQKRAAAHEKDRQAYAEKMEKLRIKQGDAHKIEWELKKRNDERTELQNALMMCQQTLLD